MEKENTTGQTADILKVNGQTTSFTVSEFTNGPMESATPAITLMT
jgi:hypothetical protein